VQFVIVGEEYTQQYTPPPPQPEFSLIVQLVIMGEA
jgi:hypothetical protein